MRMITRKAASRASASERILEGLRSLIDADDFVALLRRSDELAPQVRQSHDHEWLACQGLDSQGGAYGAA